EFHSFISATQLFEIPSKGLNYTWDNNHKDDASIRECINRGFANGSLFHTFPHHTLTYYPLIGSDHAPLLYRSYPEPKRQKRFFRFESMWTLENSCEEIIHTFWRTCVESVVSNNINSSLESPVTNYEIHKAVKELGALKAPGKDGFPGLFFQRDWHIVGDSVIMAVKQFFETGIMPPMLNKTLVVLIPKVPCPEQIGQF
nr:reverse transcriptase [Tanacetum cinerariifolium]